MREVAALSILIRCLKCLSNLSRMQTSPEMLEESIDSSPYRLDSSIRQKREHRKTKRRRLNHLKQDLSCENEKILQMYHNESEQEESIEPVKSLNNFKRFQAENMMVTADSFNLACQKKVSLIEQTVQEFWTCERLMETQFKQNTTFLSCQSSMESQREKSESVWIWQDFENDMNLQAIDGQKKLDDNCILEKTLVPNDCDKTLVEHTIDSIFTDWSPPKQLMNKTIVEKILEDFCSSPVSSESECTDLNPEDIIPFFRFRRKKIRTYERCQQRNVQDVNSNKTIKDSNNHDDHTDSDASSELSVQEDLSQVIPAVEPLDQLNTSLRIRNNLLNLSAFFTQNILDSNDPEEAEKTHLSTSENDVKVDAMATQTCGYETIKLLITEILTLRSKYPISDYLIGSHRNDSFCGLPTMDESESNIQGSFSEFNQRDIVCRSAPNLMKRTDSAIELPTSEYVKDKYSHVENFDEDSWHHDSDFFANFQTQEVLQISNAEATRIRRKSDSTLQLPTPKRIKGRSDETNIHFDEIDCRESKLAMNNKMNSKNETQIPIKHILQLFEPSQSVSNKKLEIDFDCMSLSEWPLDEKETEEKREIQKKLDFGFQDIQKKKKELQETQNGYQNASMTSKTEFLMQKYLKEKSRNNGQCTSFSGFQTASRKDIHISDEAKKNTTNIFAQLLDLPDQEIEKNVLDESTSVPQNGTEFIGFSTTTQQSIQITEEMQEQTKSPLVQSKDLPYEKSRNKKLLIENQSFIKGEKTEKSTDWINEGYGSEAAGTSNFIGFQTASRKVIKISEAAQKKITNIFAELPNLPSEEKIEKFSVGMNEGQNNKSTNTVSFTGFQTASKKAINVSEDALKKITSIFAQLPDLPDETGNKTKITNKDIFDEEVENMKRLPDWSNKNKMKEQVNSSTFTGFQTASRKAINITEESRKKIISVFAQLPELTDNSIEKTKNPSNCFNAPLDNVINNTESFTGLYTASNKVINISDEAKTKVGNIFSQLPDLPGELKSRSKLVENFDDITDMPLSEWIPSCEPLQWNQHNEIRQETEISNKRKFKSDDKTPKRERPQKVLCRSHTMYENYTHSSGNNNQNDEMKTNLNQGINSKLIGRRNLLSLTKRRRESVRMESNVKSDSSMDSIDTPVKTLSAVCTSETIIPLHTPQGSDFYSNVPKAASTPQQSAAVKISNQILRPVSDNLDCDFKRINWDNNDDSYNGNRLLDVTPTRKNSSFSNNSLKPQPSPKERIENLSSCGDPPPLPQLADSGNRSRSLGMSRRRRICSIKK